MKIRHPETGGTATVPRAAFEQTWSRKGFVLADETLETVAAEPPAIEHDEHDNPDDQEG